ncbi:MAG: hypothetical protein ACLFN8_00990 [Candidatus Woesearchaeota archaeon]
MTNIYFKDEVLLKDKLDKIKSRGFSKLHVVSDFDRTLTKCFISGKKIPSAIGLIREGGYLSEDYPSRAFALYNKYNPIELDLSLDYDFRFKMMQAWWETHEKLFVECGMHKSIIDDILVKYPNVFREGADDVLRFLSDNDIPLLIFSAGIGNLIEGYLKKDGLFFGNVHVLSNTFDFNSEGFATGYKEDVIHLMNKSECLIQDEMYLDLIRDRSCVILLGDSLDDISMVDDSNLDVVLKIGFLNDNVGEKLGLYLSKFDIVIVNDGSMSFVVDLLNNLKS